MEGRGAAALSHFRSSSVSMTPPPNLPSLLVDEGARRLALLHLEHAGAARNRLTNASDAEALHDYRVALRRLRSCLRAYRKSLRSTVTRKTLRRLRRLAHGTNRSRDLEVHLAWLEEQSARAGATERAAVAWLIERLTAEREREREEMIARDDSLFSVVHGRLVAQLTKYRTTVHLDGDSRRRSTAIVTSGLVHAVSGRLRDHLRWILGYSSTDAIHRARISAKHLRYLLEPFAPAIPDGAAVVGRLKALQDVFGDVHDAHVFADELGSIASTGGGLIPGIRALVESLEARGRLAFQQAAREWLAGAAEPFFRQVDAMADAIAALAHRDREVERKFLLTGLPSMQGAEAPVEIEQGYLPGERLVERVRRTRSKAGVELARTVKEGSGLTRLEVEEAVTPDVFASLWPLTEGRRLRKRRYRVPDGDLTWEIDEFLDRDLVLAEVELVGHPVEVDLPAWLRPHVDREVTEDEAYSNVRLASDRVAGRGAAAR